MQCKIHFGSVSCINYNVNKLFKSVILWSDNFENQIFVMQKTQREPVNPGIKIEFTVYIIFK